MIFTEPCGILGIAGTDAMLLEKRDDIVASHPYLFTDLSIIHRHFKCQNRIRRTRTAAPPSFLTAHGRFYLVLLCSQPDTVRRFPLRKTEFHHYSHGYRTYTAFFKCILFPAVLSSLFACCWPGRSGWRKGYYTQRPDLQHERRIIGMPTVAAVFYGITGSMQTAAGITCVPIGCDFAGDIYFFWRKLSLSRPASITALLVLCALPINGFSQ